MTSRLPNACDADGVVPTCDTGPGGRLLFVLREARTAWRGRTRPTKTSPADRDLTGGPR